MGYVGRGVGGKGWISPPVRLTHWPPSVIDAGCYGPRPSLLPVRSTRMGPTHLRFDLAGLMELGGIVLDVNAISRADDFFFFCLALF